MLPIEFVGLFLILNEVPEDFENIPFLEKIMNYPEIIDIRQSPEWLLYLEFLGWKKFTTSLGINGALKVSNLGRVIKVQRPKNITSQDIAQIEEIAQKRRISFIKIEPSLTQNLQILESAGYFPNGSPLCPPSTIFIDLTKTSQELWEDLSQSCKYSIKRAQREGAKVDFFISPSEENIAKFYKIHSATGKQKGFYVQSLADIQKKVDLFKEKAILATVSSSSGEVTGANLYLGFGETVWYMHGGTTTQGRKSKNGYELYWQSILYLKSLGYRWLDLEGVDDGRYPVFTKNWGGLSHFKEKFGGIRAEFPAPYVKLLSPWLKFLFKISPFQI